MSQNRRKSTGFLPNFEGVFYSILLICLAGIFIFATGSAQAAVTAHSKTDKNPTYILKTNLADMSKQDRAILDWRTQTFDLAFDLPANDWYESLDLFLSAYPEGQVAPGTPLLISYNGAKPVPLYGRGSRFEAHIRMDTSRIRLPGNSIKISYQTPRGNDCLTPANGQWVLDLSRSKLVAKARTKKRNMQIVEIEQRLAHSMTAPKRVSIVAKGANKLAYEALVAQAIAQRMPFIPEFKLDAGLADMQFVIGTHDDIRPFLNNKSILNVQGAKVLIDSGRQPKVVLSAETEDQVLELVRAFATYKLPKARRASISLHEFYSGTKMTPHAIIDAGIYKLSEIGTPVLTPSWRPDPANINFNVTDPQTASGILTLKILSAKDINPKSRLSVKLNNKHIGYTRLDKSSKIVEFRIKPGMFVASANQLQIETRIEPSTAASICETQQYIPTVLVSSHSKFRLTTSRPTPATDLSRLAAAGAPFDKDSTLVLTAKTVKDKQAALYFLGYAAQKFGPKWTNADYVSALPSQGSRDRNILIIGPNLTSDQKLLSTAPKALKLALGQKMYAKPNRKTIASTDQFMMTGSARTVKIANSQKQSFRLNSGGLAALFPSPYANDRMVGIISADRAVKFSSAMKNIATNQYWNGLQGSVTRWDKNVILMAQTATPLPASFAPPKASKFANTPKFVTTARDWFASLSTSKPVDSQPVQTASNSKQIQGIKITKPVQSLRGTLPARPEASKTAPQKRKWNESLSKLSKPTMPSMTNLKLASYQKSRAFKSWSKEASLDAFQATPLRKWWKDITHNRAAFFLLIVFIAFFAAALASPMSIRPKKK